MIIIIIIKRIQTSSSSSWIHIWNTSSESITSCIAPRQRIQIEQIELEMFVVVQHDACCTFIFICKSDLQWIACGVTDGKTTPSKVCWYDFLFFIVSHNMTLTLDFFFFHSIIDMMENQSCDTTWRRRSEKIFKILLNLNFGCCVLQLEETTMLRWRRDAVKWWEN